MSAISFISYDAARPIIAFKVHAELHCKTFHQLGFKAERYIVIDIGYVVFVLDLVSAICETAFVMIPEEQFEAIGKTPDDVRTDGPECRISLREGLVVLAGSDAPKEPHFQVLGQALLEPDRPNLRGNTLFLKGVGTTPTLFVDAEQLIRGGVVA